MSILPFVSKKLSFIELDIRNKIKSNEETLIWLKSQPQSDRFIVGAIESRISQLKKLLKN
jgi:hypothetical protein